MNQTPVIAVVIPVVQIDLAKNLLLQMSENTLIPEKVIIIDDTDSGFEFPAGMKFPIAYFRTKERAKVNLSFNLGVRMVGDVDFVTISNDDVVIHKKFFEKTVKAFRDNEKFGAVCHTQVKSIKRVGFDAQDKYVVSHEKEGFSTITLRKDVLDRIPNIPDKLVVFYGDDWYWNHIIKMGYLWGRIESSRFYHYESVSVKQREVRGAIGYDKKMFSRLDGRIVKVRLPNGI
jgi:hypothetical protein